MILSDVAIRRPVFTTMVSLGLMTMGLLGARSLGVDFFPDTSFPVISSLVVYPGASPEEVEQLVTRPIEEAVSAINGVDEVHSYSRDSVSIVIVLFKLETDIAQAMIDVRDKVGALRLNLPKEIREPVIRRIDPSAMPILTYAVSSTRGPAETRRLTDDVIKPRIESIDGVAAVEVLGGLEREVHVWVERSKLEAVGLSLAQLGQMLGQESWDVPGGRIVDGTAELNVRTLGRFRSVEELADLVVASLQNGSQVRLRDVARIDNGYKEVRTLPLLDGKPAVSFQIQKSSGSNMVALCDKVYERVAELGSLLPPDVRIVKVIDNSEITRLAVGGVSESIVFGGLMAVLVIFIFMMDWRSTLISSTALPVSVITTFAVMYWLDFSFNIVTLMGLSLAIGLLIDDAVVVRENIYRHMEHGEDPVTAAQKGTSEIGLAVTATTLTIVAVFMPMAFMGGMAGRILQQFGIVVSASVLVSLFVSFTLDPMMSARVVKPVPPGHHEWLRRHRVYGPLARGYDRLDALYREVLAWSLGHKKSVAGAATAAFLASVALVPMMGQEFVAMGDQGQFRVVLETPAATPLAGTERVVHQAEALIRESAHVKSIFTIVGPGEEANKANLRILVSRKSERPGVPLDAIQDEVRRKLAALPDLKVEIFNLAILEGVGLERGITLQVRGENFDTLQRLATGVLDVVRSTRGVKDAAMTFQPGKPEAAIHTDRARAADLGVSVGVLAQTVRLAVDGDVVAKYRSGDRDYDVRLQLAPQDRAGAAALLDLTVPATGRRMGGGGGNPMDGLKALAAMATGGPRLVRVGEIARITHETGPATIERSNRQRQITVTANVQGRSVGEVNRDMEPRLKALGFPPGYGLVFSGQTKQMNETFGNLYIALAVGILFIYFVLASQFDSFIHPFTIMVALPLAIVGAFVFMFVGGFPLSMIAMLGIMLLMGLVTKNSILLVDLTNQLRDAGMPMVEALLKAGPTRLRPILMTSAAMVLGMLPSALSRGEGSEIRAPMAIAVIGGVLTSTLLTLIVIPIVYTWMDRLTIKRRVVVPPKEEIAAHTPSGPDTA